MAELKRGEFLKDRADRFLRNALELFNREEYDLAAFNLEQASQMFLKYALWKKLGDFEKIHQISGLLEDFLEVSGDSRKVGDFIANNKEVIADLEAAYIESRYLPAQFFKEQIEKMINFAENLKSLIEAE